MNKLTIIVVLSIALLQGCQWRSNPSNKPNNLEPSNIVGQQEITPETDTNFLKPQDSPQDSTNGTGNTEQQSPPKSNNQGNTTGNSKPQSNSANNSTTNNSGTGTNNSTGGSNNNGANSKPSENNSSDNPTTHPGTSLPSIGTKHSNEYLSSVEEQVLALVNQERAKVGIGSLTMNNALRQAARYKANEMLQYNYFSHSSPYTNNPWDIAKAFGHSYTTFGENLWTMSSSSLSALKASLDASTIVNSWMNSQGHRENILKGSFSKVGIGVVVGSNGKCYASQMFSD